MKPTIQADAESAGIVPGEVFDAEQEAHRILDQARERAREIRRRAESDAEEIGERARAKGIESGRAEAAASLLDAVAARDRLLQSADREIVGLALQAAERIIGQQLSLSPEAIAAIVKPLLERARRATQVTLRVHPDDVPLLRASLPALTDAADLSAAVTVDPDPAMARGGCLLQSDIGTLDARVEFQLAELARILAD
jgi:type III secretion system HrpE/YscL family protein